MDTIERAELVSLLREEAATRVVMVLGPHRFAQAHIPGSTTYTDLDEALDAHPPLAIINSFLLAGMATVGELFASGGALL